MIKPLLFIAILFHGGIFLAQQQLENASFENWQNLGGPTEEPTEWSSIKTSDAGSFINNAAPQVCERSTDAHTGTYSVKLTNKSVFSVIATGMITNGRAHGDTDPENGYVFTEVNDSQWNTPFTSRPDSIVGWFKYAPASGDKAKVEAILHTGSASNPENGTAGNFVGRARFITSSTVGSWTRFSTPFSYFNSNTPSHVLLVLTSGDSTIAKNGSIAYYDDIEMIYNPVSVEEINPLSVIAFQKENSICVQIPSTNSKSIVVKVYDLQGRVINTESKLNIGTNLIEKPKNNGIYLVNVNFDGKMITKKIVVSN